MRDFRDAKSMAQTLRHSLTDKALAISHSESLELVSRMLGVADWNTLSAMLKDSPRPPAVSAAARSPDTTRYPAIPIRDIVPFPSMVFPLFIGREKTRQALEQAFARQREVVLAVQKDEAIDDPGFDHLYEIGTLARLMEVERLPDDTLKVLVQVHRRVIISSFVGENGAYQAEIENIGEGPIPDAPDLIERAVARFKDYATTHDVRLIGTVPPLDQMRDPGRLADVIASQMVLPLRSKQASLATLDPLQRLQKVYDLMDKAVAPAHAAALIATLDRAIANAIQRRHKSSTLEHLLLALADDSDASAVMEQGGVDLALLRTSLTGYMDTGLTQLVSERDTAPRPTDAFQRVMQRAGMQAWDMQRSATSGADVLAALLGEWKSPAVQMLVQQRMTQRKTLMIIATSTRRQ